MKPYALAVALAMTLTACGQQSPQTAAPSAPVADQPAEATPPKSAEDLFAEKLDQVLAGDWRSEANKARDVYRHPKETLAFFGLKPGQSVLEITPGGGWYAEILAPLQKGNGTYVAALPKDEGASEYTLKNNTALREKFAADPERYSDVHIASFDPKAPDFAMPGSLDTVLTFRNVHNWVMADTAPLMFKAFFDVLKPGGTLGVVDHRAPDGAGLDAVKQSGYLPVDYVIKLATDAGFELVAQSEINANPDDTKDYEKGVWTLPPTLALGPDSSDRYRKIGESDRMTLKFVKPAGDQIFQQGTDGGAPKH